MAHTFTLFKTLKVQGYLIKAVYIAEENQSVAKTFIDDYFPFADEIFFHLNEGEDLPRLGYKWIRHSSVNGSGVMHHVSTHLKIKAQFDASLKQEGSDITWSSIFQKFPHSIEFIEGAGRN